SLPIAFRLPLSCYTGGLIGLQRQVLLNVLNMIMETSRGLGSVLILWLVSPTVEAFFLWQAAVSVAHVGLIAFFFWRALPTIAEPPRFRRELLLNIWRFAAGMIGINVLVTILLQEDKIILSRMLNLELFGYYTLAFTVAASMSIFASPVFKATYPRLTNLVTLGSTKELIRLYHESAQLVAVFILPAAIIVTLFSKEILLLWTQNPETADQTHLLVSILVIGTALNGLMTIPYALQLAFGWTRLALFLNLVAVLVLVPFLIALTMWYGVVGAASVWVILNVSYLIIGIHFMHRRLLPTEKWRWYFRDVGLPFGVAVLVAGILRLIIPIPGNTIALIAFIVMFSTITLGATALATPVTRNWLQAQILDWRVSRKTKS
ncbi:oligosaccharide flippase family protein, partial [Chloroflexota bacterium]